MTLRHLIESLLSKYDEQQRKLALFGMDDGDHTARTALMVALPTLTDWHKRPTCPGLYLCFDEHGMSYQENVDNVNNFNLTYEGSCVFGPIPSPPEETTT
jgi:hypothetical protein